MCADVGRTNAAPCLGGRQTKRSMRTQHGGRQRTVENAEWSRLGGAIRLQRSIMTHAQRTDTVEIGQLVPASMTSTSSSSRGGRPRVCVLGSGWAAVAFLKRLSTYDTHYDVTVVSPRNYFLYTPLLPGAATGAIEGRSIVEPVRRALSDKNFTFYEAMALRIEPGASTSRGDEKANGGGGGRLICRAADLSSEEDKGMAGSCPWHVFDVEYDYLVVACGAVPNTFGVPGVAENAMFFKEACHADRFRREVTERFERAALPGTPVQRVKETLTFIIVGGGPTGVELAAELYDFVVEDVSKVFPPYLKSLVSIKIIDLMDFILSTYDRRIAEYATAEFRRNEIDLLLNKQVVAVRDGVLIIRDRETEEESLLPFGLCVWCTGIGLNPLCSQLIDVLPEGAQDNKRALKVDKHLRVLGSGGSIFALGDCATVVRPKSMGRAEDLFREGGSNLDRRIGLAELQAMLRRGSEEFSHLEELANRAEDAYNEIVDADGQNGLNFEQFKEMLAKTDAGLRSFPATAQVAKQEGEYLADLFNTAEGDSEYISTREDTPAFRYQHRGSLAYIGRDTGVADIPGFTVLKGLVGGLVWKGFETWSQVGWRNRFLVLADMIRAKLFGRDMSRL